MTTTEQHKQMQRRAAVVASKTIVDMAVELLVKEHVEQERARLLGPIDEQDLADLRRALTTGTRTELELCLSIMWKRAHPETKSEAVQS